MVNAVIIIDEERSIKVCEAILKIMKNYIQNSKRDLEAGGIIIGRENLGNENIVLEYITEPMEKDRRSRNRFYREDKEHLEYYEKLYQENDEIYAYYGEWHTHPENTPHYSIIDMENWRRISNIKSDAVQYHIIVGIKKIVIWKMNKGYFIPKKVSEVEWSEIDNKES